jgi:hypothetical protein
MIWIFTCSTDGCIYNVNPVRTIDPTNPVMCGACFCYTDAVETDEPAPTPEPEQTPEPVAKAKK